MTRNELRTVLESVDEQSCLLAIKDLSAGPASFGFGESRRWDVLYQGKRYSPKAVIGLAARTALGTPLKPSAFLGGKESLCNEKLRALGFEIVERTGARPSEDMKALDWDEAQIARLREKILSADACAAFDILIAHARTLRDYQCGAGAHGHIQGFRYLNRESFAWPFAFIANQGHLLFYVRRAGLPKLEDKKAKFEMVFGSVRETKNGEWRLRISNEAEAKKLISLVFGSRAAALPRVDPALSQQVVNSILSNCSDQTREYCLAFLATSIQYAYAAANDRWSLTLHKDYIRFNVGWVESVLINRDGISILVSSDPHFRAGTKSGRYPKAGGSRLLGVRYADVGGDIEQIRFVHQEAMRLAAKHPIQPHLKRAHSPGVVEFLWSYLGLDMPVPSPNYWTYWSGPPAISVQAATELADEDAEREVRQRTDIGPREKTRLVNARRGQGIYRENLLLIEKSCRVTGIDDPKHLRASHIKPWRLSDDREKIDGYNGLLLSPHIDHLFDGGYISFNDDGTMLVSDSVSSSVLEGWNLSLPANVGEFRAEQRIYLKFHREMVFKK